MIRVSSSNLLQIYLEIEPNRQQQYHTKRLALVMRKLGWKGPAPIKMADGKVVRGYQRPMTDWGDPDDPVFKRKY